MHDAGAVCPFEGARDLDRVAERFLDAEPLSRETLGEGRALDELHHDVVAAFVAADVVHRADMGVVQGRDDASFLLEPAAELSVGGVCFRKDLDGDAAIQPRVARAIDLAHAPRAEERIDVVRAESRSWAERQRATKRNEKVAG